MVGPGPKQQLTSLLIIRELLYVHGADALQHTGKVVVHSAVRVDVRAVFLQTDEIIRNAERFRAIRNFKLLINIFLNILIIIVPDKLITFKQSENYVNESFFFVKE